MSSTLFLCTPVLESHGNILAKQLDLKRLTFKYSYLMNKKQLYVSPTCDAVTLALENCVLTTVSGFRDEDDNEDFGA